MSKHKKQKKPVIPPEKMAILAEKGLKAAKLTKKEKEYLLRAGLKEIYDLWDFTKQAIPPLEAESVDAIMNRFFSERPKLWIRIREKIIEMVEGPSGLIVGSPAFAHRESGTKSISFQKKAERWIVHLEIVRGDKRHVDIHIRLTDNSGKDISPFEIALFKGERCIETLSTTKGHTLSLFAIEIGYYSLRVSDSKGEITSIFIKMES
ncbi:MAG: hypothetical protein ACMUIU_06230 [bacterium]